MSENAVVSASIYALEFTYAHPKTIFSWLQPVYDGLPKCKYIWINMRIQMQMIEHLGKIDIIKIQFTTKT